jgi:hypothetical protein
MSFHVPQVIILLSIKVMDEFWHILKANEIKVKFILFALCFSLDFVKYLLNINLMLRLQLEFLIFIILIIFISLKVHLLLGVCLTCSIVRNSLIYFKALQKKAGNCY